MPFHERGDVRIHYQEAGSGFPLFIIYGGGLNSKADYPNGPFDAVAEFKDQHRCISMDLRNANSGKSIGPLPAGDPWEAITDDQLSLLDHLGVDRFLVMGFCIGNPLIWNLLQKAPGRVVAAVSAQPSGMIPGGDAYFIGLWKRDGWVPNIMKTRPEVTREAVEDYLDRMYKGREFVATTTRAFVRRCGTPLLVLPDDTKAHPYAVAMEMAHLAPNAQVSLYPWKDTPKNTELAVRHVRTFLRANDPLNGA